jgi:hypothetical protein
MRTLMNKNIILSLITLLVICIASFDVHAQRALSEEQVGAIHTALDDEYKAYTTYKAYLEHFGDVRPFSNIISSEARHIEALSSLLAKNGLPVPKNTYEIDSIDVPNSLKEACEVAVAAEVHNDKLYRNELIPTVSDQVEVKVVFENLADASKYRHLKAFERCVANR